jgi:ABC-type Fe3+/spermidine/putrescine transport system ATPase subunit
VATFLGTANLWPGTVTATDTDGITCSVGGASLRVSGRDAGPGDSVSVMVRPERVEVSPTATDADGANILKARVDTLTFRGAHTNVLLACAELRVEAQVANLAGSPPEWLSEGADVAVQISPKALRVLVD